MINFGDCLVRSEGAVALAAVLREGLPILKVSVRSQLRTWFPFVSLPSHSALSCNFFFQELNLSFGEITEAAALVVAQAVADKADMEKLDLNGMHIDHEMGLYVFGERRSRLIEQCCRDVK